MSSKTITVQHNKTVDELSEDMEVVGPGQMLSEARSKLSLSVEDVTDKLKFKKGLVQNIEQDIFDQKLPATFNRGYLRNYAKLVHVDIDEVLSAYDMLGVAEVQRSEMQSFSNLTEKQAEHSRIMWFSYLIVTILFGLMVLWWLQEPKQLSAEKNTEVQQVIISDGKSVSAPIKSVENAKLSSLKLNKAPLENISLTGEQSEQTSTAPETIQPKNITANVIISEKSTHETSQKPVAELSSAIFTFSGDCWVNIYDATGERIAWGVKKSGYVMTITGKAPLKVTLGKPELAAIVFNGQPIDMSAFDVGNIAKFTLPINL
ncbi:MAG: DUF4115 domain-containing protein [Colwellia sp.]|nr:DUF4115 domain-containing protein [Colwellia sp.]